MANTLKFGNGEWYGKKDTILAYNDENYNYKPLPFSFDRASSATVVNKAGLIETVGSGEPRIDYKDDVNGSLLLEPQRSNYWTDSEGSAITLNSPLGEFGFYTLNNTLIDRTITYIGTITFTFIVKKIDGTIPTITTSSGSGDLAVLVSGGSTAGVSGVLTDIGNGFYKYELTTEASGASVARIRNHSGLDTYVSLIQYEEGSYATSYIPTQGSTVTRLADTCTNGGNDQVFNNNTSVWFIDFSRFIYDSSIATKSIVLEDSSGAEQIRFHFDQPANTVRFRDALNSFSTIGGYISTLANTRKKVALKIDGTTLSVFSDGVKIGSDYTRPTGFDISKMALYSGGTNVFDIKFYNTALTDNELQQLTTI